MKNLANLSRQPSGVPLAADDVLEFHAARILLLLQKCGQNGWIQGLTKFAKLDFFVRYPSFFAAATGTSGPGQRNVVESSMVRHHYGPWDPRYYHLLAYLSSKGLITTSKYNNRYDIGLTETGINLAAQLAGSGQFVDLISHMEEVGRNLANLTGSKLKTMIYQTFDDEVARLPHGEIIE